jgi:hypothetical protein
MHWSSQWKCLLAWRSNPVVFAGIDLVESPNHDATFLVESLNHSTTFLVESLNHSTTFSFKHEQFRTGIGFRLFNVHSTARGSFREPLGSFREPSEGSRNEGSRNALASLARSTTRSAAQCCLFLRLPTKPKV